MPLRRRWSEIAGELHLPEAPGLPPASSPWFVRVLIGVGAWLAALLLLGGVVAGLRGVGGLVPIGTVALVAGIAVLRLASGDFGRQLGLASSMAGQLALAIGLAEAVGGAAFAALALGIEGALVAVVPAPVHRFSSTVLMVAATTGLLASLRLPACYDVAILIVAVAAGAFWVDQPRRLRARGVDRWTPAGYGLVIGLFGLLLFVLTARVANMGTLWGDGVSSGRLASAGLGLGTVGLGLLVAAEIGVARPGPLRAAALAAVALLGLATPSSPGVAGAVAVLLLGLHRRNPALVALAILFLVAFLTLLYYSLQASLLAKAIHLMTAGSILMAGAWLVHRGRRAP